MLKWIKSGFSSGLDLTFRGFLFYDHTYRVSLPFYIFHCSRSLFCDRRRFIVETVFLPLVLASFLLFLYHGLDSNSYYEIRSWPWFIFIGSSGSLGIRQVLAFLCGRALLLLLSQWLCWTTIIFIPLSSLCHSQECLTCDRERIASLSKPSAILLLCFISNFGTKSHHFSHCKAIMQHSLSCYGTFHSDQWRSRHNLPFCSQIAHTRTRKQVFSSLA